MTDRSPCTVRWLEPLADALARDRQAVLVIVARCSGSTPREAGRGDGRVAATAVTAPSAAAISSSRRCASRAMRSPPTRRAGAWIVRFPLAARLGQCCGGVATLAFAKVDRRATRVARAALTCARTGDTVRARHAHRAGDGATGDRLLVTRRRRARVARRRARSIRRRSRLRARASQARRSGAALVRFADDDATTLLVQIERPDPFPVLVFGNGHVGRALVQVLGALPAQVRWIDAREDDFPAAVPRQRRDRRHRRAGGRARARAARCVRRRDDAQPRARLRADRDRARARRLALPRPDRLDVEARPVRAAARRARHCAGSARARRLPDRRATASRSRSKDPGAIAIAVAAEIARACAKRAHASRPHRARPGRG